MKKTTILQLVIFLTFLSVYSVAGVLHFENSDIVYPEKYYDVAVKIGNIFESVREGVIDLIGYDPGRITIVLQDKGTISNGFTQVLFNKTITLYVWPPESYVYFMLPFEDWYTYLIIHEFTHMCHLLYQDELAKFISIVTGIPYLPQLSSPFIEGTTVFAESFFSQSSGRLNNPFFSSGLYYYSIPNFPSFTYKEIIPQDDYRGGMLYYNFTAGFYKYLVKTYGNEKMKKFLSKTSETAPEFLKFLQEDKESKREEEIEDPFEYAFGKNFNELYTDWILSLTKLDYKQGELIYKLPNSHVIKLDFVGKQVSILKQSFGPVTSYIGSFESGVIVIDDEKKAGKYSVKREIPLNALDVRYDGKRVYALTPTYTLGTYSNSIWEVNSNSLIESGNITSFGVKNDEIFVCYFDPVSEKSTIKKIEWFSNTRSSKDYFEYTYNGFIRTIDVSEKYIAFITMDNKIFVLDRSGKEILNLQDRNMKGPFVKILDNKILFSRVEGEYVIPYYYDIVEKKFFKLSDKTLLSDFTIQGDYMYYVSYIPYGVNSGMGIYKKKIELEGFDKLPNENPPSKIAISNKSYRKGDEVTFRFGKFIRPVTWAPMMSTQVQEDKSLIHNFYMIFTFANVENDTFFVLTPIVDVFQPTPDSFNFEILGYRQFFSFLTSKEIYSLSGSYIYPSNDYSLNAELLLGSFYVSPITSLYAYLGASLKSDAKYNLDSIFSLIGAPSVPSIKSNTFSLGLQISTMIFGRRLRNLNWLILSDDNLNTILKPENLYIQSSLAIPFNLDISFLGIVAWNLSQPINAKYDFSVAATFFKDSAELFNGLVLFKNSGLTFGLANPSNIHGLYTHFFAEMYLSVLKFYPSVGVFLPMMELYGLPRPDFNGIFYIGLGSTPHMLNIISGFPF